MHTTLCQNKMPRLKLKKPAHMFSSYEQVRIQRLLRIVVALIAKNEKEAKLSHDLEKLLKAFQTTYLQRIFIYEKEFNDACSQRPSRKPGMDSF